LIEAFGTATGVPAVLNTSFNFKGDLFSFFSHNKWWWLTPMIIVLLIFGGLVILAESSAVAPFIYTLV